MEREKRFELSTPTLARLCSTAELFPHAKDSYCNVECLHVKLSRAGN